MVKLLFFGNIIIKKTISMKHFRSNKSSEVMA
jgi:hypothetical protein